MLTISVPCPFCDANVFFARRSEGPEATGVCHGCATALAITSRGIRPAAAAGGAAALASASSLDTPV